MCSCQQPYLVLQAGLFSAVSSAFVIDVYPKLQPDPNDRSAALLLAILLTLNQSAIPDGISAALPVQEDPPSGIVAATGLLYASLLISLLAAFIAMLGKQWLNRYLRHSGGSMIERCGDRQRKCDGLEKWPFHLFVESLPVMLQIALLLLACGLCRYMASVNHSVAYILTTLTGLGILFYVGILIAGASSHDCPFQTPASVPLRGLWKRIRPCLVYVAFPATITLPTLEEIVELHMFRIIHLSHLRSFSEKIQLGILRVWLCLSQTWLNIRPRFRHPLLPTGQEGSRPLIQRTITGWRPPDEFSAMKNANDARCVSWVIKKVTDPEALDVAIQQAGTIQWFEDGIDVEPLYDTIVSIFHTCFGPHREPHPGSTDRAYYSGRAMLWIHTLAMCKSRTFPLPPVPYSTTGPSDLLDLLTVLHRGVPGEYFAWLLRPDLQRTPSHMEWVSNLLLHPSWAQITFDPSWIYPHRISIDQSTTPSGTTPNCLLMFCNLLGFPVEEEVLQVQGNRMTSHPSILHVAHTYLLIVNSFGRS